MQANKRLIKDIQTMMSDEMASMGIYYSYDDADMRKGVALVFGPDDTPYQDCPLFFTVSIPNDYPFSSPAVLISSSDGRTRFHPNLYVNGKVCLSILGTYTGPSWASTLNIGSVFKSIVSLLDKNPIVNEPGWERYTLDYPSAKEYSEWVEYHLISMILVEYTQYKVGTNQNWKLFGEVFERGWSERWSRIQEKIRKNAETIGLKVYKKIPYGMSGEVDWIKLRNSLDKI